ncbi:MAG: sigma-54 interaction domain-containing protein [Polyangiales bacterium]
MSERDQELLALRACVRDLAALSALPAMWIGRSAEAVMGSFLEVLVASLRLDVAYIRVADPNGDPLEGARADGVGDLAPHMDAIRATCAPMLLPHGDRSVANPVGPGVLRVAVAGLSVDGSYGVVTGSRRADYPTQLETMVLAAAVNHASIWLSAARSEVARRKAEAELVEREQENAYLREEVELPFGRIVGQSGALRAVLAELELVARTDATVLLLGESGTGKELFAREIHERSRRRDRALIRVNCSAIPREMFESEFFGHVRGAFTGALRDRPGRFQLAERGTLFLDEIGDMPLEVQPKLLRVLQEGQYERVGDDLTRDADVRIIAATHRDLAEEVRAGRFREDLYYRLTVFPLVVPPLRDRREDVALLANHFIAAAAQRLGIRAPVLSSRQLDSLRHYDWPGNVRELQNVIERAVILSNGGELRLPQLGERLSDRPPAFGPSPQLPAPPALPALDFQEVISAEEWRRREKANVERALARAEGRIYGAGGAAELLGLKPSTLQSRMRALDIPTRGRGGP